MKESTHDRRRGILQNVAVTGLPMFLFAVALLISRWAQPDQSPYRTFADLDAFSIEGEKLVGSLLPVLTAGSKFERRFQVNKPGIPGSLNVYVVDLTNKKNLLPKRLADAFNNCAYTDVEKTIIIDVQFLRSFECRHGSRGLSGTAGIIERNSLILLWELVHEIGHAVHGDGAAHFRASSFFSEGDDRQAIQLTELAADRYMVEKVSADRGLSMALFAAPHGDAHSRGAL